MKIVVRFLVFFFCLISARFVFSQNVKCAIQDSGLNDTNWITLNQPYYIFVSDINNVTPPVKAVLKFNSNSNFKKLVNKFDDKVTSDLEVDFPLVLDWENNDILGPAQMIVSTGDGNCSLDFEIAPAAYSPSDLPKLIPATNSVDSSVTSAGIGTIKRVRVSVWIDHPNDSDLSLSLISPDGTTVGLSSGNGGSAANYGQNCAYRTIFADESSGSITVGAAPFTGVYQPEQPLSAFAGKTGSQANGSWTLRVVNSGGSVGTVRCWSLSIDE